MSGKNSEVRRVDRVFGSELDVEELTGGRIKAKTLQKDRLLGRNRFPYYKVGGRVLYDLAEVESVIRGSARGGTAA